MVNTIPRRRRRGPQLLWSCLPSIAVLVGWNALSAAQPHSEVHRAVAQTARANSRSAQAAADRQQLPIGLFDSGTGGLTVLEQILTLDLFDNQTHALREGGDGRPDFADESFVFLADQANMPYGHYPAVGKTGVLDNLILRDAQFLLGCDEGWTVSPSPSRPKKPPAKAIAIACNTATAYGLVDIQQALADAHLILPLVGVIEAGATGAIEALAEEGAGAVGVLATAGTVASGAYPVALRHAAAQRGIDGPVIVQQGALGLAGAIDGAREYIVRGVGDHEPREDYRGPSPDHRTHAIDLAALPRYGFDFSNAAILYRGAADRPSELQLNSVENYIAYHVTSLLETLRRTPDSPPLRVVVLGCTHFPYDAARIRHELQRLYDYREKGHYPYRPVLAKRIRLIDPAIFTARQLYETLQRQDLLRPPGADPAESRFYITEPLETASGVQLDDQGSFTYEYKYGRDANQWAVDYRAVPLLSARLASEDRDRLRRRAPAVWRLLQESARAREPMGAASE